MTMTIVKWFCKWKTPLILTSDIIARRGHQYNLFQNGKESTGCSICQDHFSFACYIDIYLLIPWRCLWWGTAGYFCLRGSNYSTICILNFHCDVFYICWKSTSWYDNVRSSLIWRRQMIISFSNEFFILFLKNMCYHLTSITLRLDS